MAELPISESNGEDLFNGTTTPYAFDDNADSKTGLVYTHNSKRWSAHAAEQAIDWLAYISALLQGDYDLDSVSVTGGTINGVVIGGVTPAAGHFTTISASGDITTSQAIGRDTDNEIAWTTDNQLDITINGTTTAITSISTGASDNDKLVTQGYVDDAAGDVSPLTTKGDLYTYDTDDARLAIGTNGQVLTADSAEATGMKWADAIGGGITESNFITLNLIY